MTPVHSCFLFLSGRQSFSDSLPQLFKNLGSLDSVVFIIADGGLRYFLDWVPRLPQAVWQHVTHVIWAGDGDSICGSMMTSLTSLIGKHNDISFSVIKHKTSKKDSDFRLCLNQLLKVWQGKNSLNIYCVGFIGGRQDHELCNFLELDACIKEHVAKSVFVRVSSQCLYLIGQQVRFICLKELYFP